MSFTDWLNDPWTIKVVLTLTLLLNTVSAIALWRMRRGK